MLPLLFLLGACATAPPETAVDLDVPETWSARAEPAPETPPAGAWWTGFGAAELDAIVAEALERNYDLQAAAAAVDAALAQARIAGADRLPQVRAGVDAARRQQVFVGLPIPGGPGVLSSTSTSYGASLNVGWEADLWGRLRAGEAAAVADAEAAAASLDAARLSVAGQTAKAWLATLEARRQVALAEATLDSRRRTSERVGSRYRRGVAPSLELRLARSNEAQAQAALELRRRIYDATARQLEVLAGGYPDAEVALAADLPPLPPPIPAGLPAELVVRRPDLRAAERRLAAAGWRVSAARRALYPRLSLTGAGGTASDGLADLLDSDFTVWSLAGSLLAPIFEGGRLRAAVELAEASRERALAEYAQSALRAFAEVETALAAERYLALEEAAQTEAVAQAQAAARLAEERYVRGVGDYLTILESQRQTFAAEVRLLALRAQRLTNRVDLHLALGGDFGGRKSPLAPLFQRGEPEREELSR